MGIGTAYGELLTTQLGSDPAFGPCRWPADLSCVDLPTSATVEVTGAIMDAAVELVWALSGRQFGECGVTLRPCRASCMDQYGYRWNGGGWAWPHPIKLDGEWLNLACGDCAGECSCGPVERVYLPSPVTRITEVVIDGVAMDDSAWRVDNRRILIRQDGGRWPICQKLSKPAGEVGTWTVFGFYGREVPSLGQLALGEVFAELVKFCVGAEDCQLPANWQTITRAGITISRPTTAAAGDLESSPSAWLPFTREFLRAYNPNRLNARARVWSPDIPRPSRTF